MGKREVGIVHHYNILKGFGFIRREKGKDVFFFFNDFESTADVVVGDQVEFLIKLKEKGPRAYNIKILK